MGTKKSEDWEFIFDGVVGYLTSPMWQIPVMSFMEKNCLVFDASEENCFSWQDVHDQFKSMVERLLTSYLNDVGITDEQFVKACGSQRMQDASRMQTIFEQIWAAEDFEVFKRMMVQKNVELELQALQLIQQRHVQGSGGKVAQNIPHKKRQADEDEILREVMRQSKEEYERTASLKDEKKKFFDTRLEKIIASSERENERLKEDALQREVETKESMSQAITKSQPVEQSAATVEGIYPDLSTSAAESKAEPVLVRNRKKLQDKPTKEKLTSDTKLKEITRRPPPIDTQKQRSYHSRSSAIPTDEIKTTQEESSPVGLPQPSTSTTKSNSTTDEDLKAREKYLKEQRDRLMAMKKQEREKRLDQYVTTQPARPTSARVARGVVNDEKSNQTGGTASGEQLDPKKLAMRKALAERLKKEVVNK